MAIGAEVLPVGAVRRIVPVVAVFMMHCEESPVFEIELPRAFGAYQAVDFQGLLPVIGDRGIALFQFPDDFSGGLACRGLLRQGFSEFHSLSASQKLTPCDAALKHKIADG